MSRLVSRLVVRPHINTLFYRPAFPLATKSLALGLRFNSSPPKQSDPDTDLRANDLASRIPKFPFHKDVAPTLIPKADTPRVGPNMTFSQLMLRLKQSQGPELIYMSESHRLYFIACMALSFIAAYNLFDILDMGIPLMVKSYQENDLDGTAMENLAQLVRRFGMVFALAGCYLVAGLTFATIPSRLVRRIEYIPGSRDMIRLVVHPIIPGRPSPVITAPLDHLSIGKRAKVWSGDGFYGTASKSSFFFFIWEEGKRLPWIVDRSGWFWGDGRVYDVLFGKEPVKLAEMGVSYDDMLKQRMLKAEEKKNELRKELGPAWRFKAMGQLMKEDVAKFSDAGRRAVLNSVNQTSKNPKSIASNNPPNEPKQAQEQEQEKQKSN